jgi:dipeptidyl aminopeptidase/acylaminoacyl peptidase
LEENLFVDITVDPDNKDGHYHLALYDITKQTRTFLTSGSYDVVEISSFNTVSKEVFYASTEYGSTNRTIKAVKYDGTKTSRFISKEGNQGYFTASFSPSGSYYQLSYLGPNLPIYTLEQTNPTPGSNASIVLLENSAVKQKIEENVQLPSVEIKTINNRAGVPLNALFVYPPTYNANSDVKYPCIMRVYGGPGNQLVLNSWNSMHDPLGLYWASLGFVVVTVDSTGTGGRGEKFMTATYKNLGDLESQDQVFAAKYLQGLYFIDGTKLGIWGWSYGGYMTLMSLTHPENDKVFKLGMAVAPVTDWRYYDSAYTERYMQWPAINPEGYKNSSVIQRVVRAEPKCPLLPVQIKANGDAEQAYSHLLLIHGTGDDNVHPLNSYNLMTTLQDRQVQFTNMFYPNKDHSISGGNTRRQLYRLLTNTLQAKLLA